MESINIKWMKWRENCIYLRKSKDDLFKEISLLKGKDRESVLFNRIPESK